MMMIEISKQNGGHGRVQIERLVTHHNMQQSLRWGTSNRPRNVVFQKGSFAVLQKGIKSLHGRCDGSHRERGCETAIAQEEAHHCAYHHLVKSGFPQPRMALNPNRVFVVNLLTA